MIPPETIALIRRIEVRTKGLVDSMFGGEYSTAFRGQGVEFAEVRPYQMGDDVRSIDWNVSARMGETYVKLYDEEREQQVMLAVDVSGSGRFGTHRQFKRELAAELCALVGFSAIRNSDKVGLLLFSDRIERFVPARKGRRHVLRLVRDLFAHEPEGRKTDIAGAADHLGRVLKRRSIVLLLSDFFDDGFEHSLRVLHGRHDTVALQLVDPRDLELPAVGLVELTDAETDETLLVDTQSPAVRTHIAAQARARQEAIEAALRHARIDHVQIRTDRDYVQPLIRFFRVRNRRA